MTAEATTKPALLHGDKPRGEEDLSKLPERALLQRLVQGQREQTALLRCIAADFRLLREAAERAEGTT